MALSESSRSQIYQGLVNFVSEEAIGEMLSYFPARDVEEPVTKEFLRAEMSDLRAEMSDLGSQLRSEMSGLRSELKGDIAGLQGQITGLQGQIAGLQGQIDGLRHMMMMNAGLVAAVGAVIIAAVKI